MSHDAAVASPSNGQHGRTRWRDPRFLALLTALVALVAGFTDPEIAIGRSVHRQLLVFDITQSMNVVDDAEDASARTRLDRARVDALNSMAAMRCGSEVGIGLFSGHRTLVLFAPVEICAHYGDIAATVRAIDWRMAWEARSEVAKGLHSALLAARALGRGTTIVFVTDGHEAPPVGPERAPRFRGTVGDVRGAVLGVGGDRLRPIPKLSASGRRRGFWKHDDVLQVDPAMMGRVGSSLDMEAVAGVDRRALLHRIAAGTEHLSSLKESYLKTLVEGLGLHYARLEEAQDLGRLLEHPQLAQTRPARLELRHALAALALSLVAGSYLVSVLEGQKLRRRQITRRGRARASTGQAS